MTDTLTTRSAADTLTDLIHSAISPDASPRPVQVALTCDIEAKMLAAESGDAPIGERRCAHIAPVGSGKSFAYLVPAALAATRGHRTVISTESINLQTQLAVKDAPAVAETLAAAGLRKPVVAVVKGVSNYVCLHEVERTIHEIESSTGFVLDQHSPARLLAGLRRAGVDAELSGVLMWACELFCNETAVGDRLDCPSVISDEVWAKVSSSRCASKPTDKTRLCGHARAKKAGASADIVITNHALLAVQAVRNVPAVFGGAIGDFTHVVIDEAHQLPHVIRSQGHTRLEVRSVEALADALTPIDRQTGEALREVADDMRAAVSLCEPGEIDLEEEGFSALFARARVILTSAEKVLASVPSVSEATWRMFMRTQDALAAFPTPDEDDQGVQWIEGASVETSPVDVSGIAHARLFGKRSVSCVSGTLPRTFTRDSGVGGKVVEHASPFADAYARSRVVIAMPNERQWSRLERNGSLDLRAHEEWAADVVVRYVNDNGGATLVLAATTQAGKRYAQALRARGRGYDVYTQWDGVGVGESVRRFRENASSVLVGVKSLMTGTDVSGDSLTQVIIDRVPRARPNIVDDARVEARIGSRVSAFRARHEIYTVDASLVLTQACGRLIRSADDHGQVVVLDPRLSPNSPVTYAKATRAEYRRSFAPFGEVLDQVTPGL